LCLRVIAVLSQPFVSGSRGCEPLGYEACASMQQAAPYHGGAESSRVEVGAVRTEPNTCPEGDCQDFFTVFQAVIPVSCDTSQSVREW
jgi:hypothetical protein